jgi:hypothetical protein
MRGSRGWRSRPLTAGSGGSVAPTISFGGAHNLCLVFFCGRGGDSMGNVHDSVEVASLVTQGDLMHFHQHPTIDLVVLVVSKSLLVNHLRYGLGTVLALSDQHATGLSLCLCSYLSLQALHDLS